VLQPKKNIAKHRLVFLRRNFSSARFGRLQKKAGISVLQDIWFCNVCYQLDVSEEYPEVLCSTKLLFAPPSLHDRIAGLAWQVFIFAFYLKISKCLISNCADQNQGPEGSSAKLD
jgi:hypothetical protein